MRSFYLDLSNSVSWNLSLHRSSKVTHRIMSCIFALFTKHKYELFFLYNKEGKGWFYVCPPLLIMFLVHYHNKQKLVIVTIVPQNRGFCINFYQIWELVEMWHQVHATCLWCRMLVMKNVSDAEFQIGCDAGSSCKMIQLVSVCLLWMLQNIVVSGITGSRLYLLVDRQPGRLRVTPWALLGAS